jgi:mannose-6-phosphate isomerase-like protein (cupin superfamily)
MLRGHRAIVLFTALILSAATLFGTDDAPANAPRPVAHAVSTPGLAWGPCPAFLPKGCEIAVLNGDPSKNNADIFFRVPANSVIASHWHTSAERMVLVSGELDVTYEGHDTVSLKTGMYAYGPARLPHSAKCGASAPCVLFIAFEEPVDAVETTKTAK